ncbi:TPA: hypothetical protein F3L15_18560 [Aeromonas hydrophila]|uniref:hypothetical protein n=1 Tax=Aeromonas hydrophila TaxID=644 RepID=UPI000B11F475|nr:hypothetical protein [Aeromonas hydrophila]MBW3845640.1 hypothetical protein [Aeromonas hydrophila]HAU4886005.1 hypothetical protein [Aeromonas hydrophila]
MKHIELQGSLFWKFSGQPQIIFEEMTISIRNELARFGIAFLSPATYIPVPDGVQPEIPRAQLISTDNRFTINISYISISINYNIIDMEHSIVTDRFYNSLLSIYNALIQKGFLFNRIGIVSKSYNSGYEPADWIHSNTIKESIKKDNLIEAGINLVYRKSTGKFPYNEVVNISNGYRHDTSEKVILITRDINTVQDQLNTLERDVFDEFVSLTKRSFECDALTSITRS